MTPSWDATLRACCLAAAHVCQSVNNPSVRSIDARPGTWSFSLQETQSGIDTETRCYAAEGICELTRILVTVGAEELQMEVVVLDDARVDLRPTLIVREGEIPRTGAQRLQSHLGCGGLRKKGLMTQGATRSARGDKIF